MSHRKLTLNRETFKVLTTAQLGTVAGGTGDLSVTCPPPPPTYNWSCGPVTNYTCGSGALSIEICDTVD